MKRIVLLFLILTVFSSRAFAVPTYLGSGTIGDPYVVITCKELQDVNAHRNEVGVYFKLGTNIDCSETRTWLGVGEVMKGFAPIGTAAVPFMGHFDGANYFIKNLTMYYTAGSDEAGIFGGTQDLDINNLGIIDVNIFTSTSRAGAIAGTSNGNTDLNQVYVLGGRITGLQYTGGLIGLGGFDDNFYSVYTKDVNVNNGTYGSIGGLNGYARGSYLDCYSTSQIYSTGANKGGLAGVTTAGALATTSYWNPTDSIVVVSALGTELTQANMWKEAQYVGWDFDNIWGIEEDVNTPIFIQAARDWFGKTPDFNFVSIGGELFIATPNAFAYLLDGNLAIDFNVFMVDNNRLSMDLNYSDSNAAGTGSVIVKDLNLSSAICTDQDWDDVPSLCSWDFNIIRSLVADGNYFLLGRLSSTPTVAALAKSSIKPSPTSFIIANDLNLVVNIPINEETGVAIDTSVSSFIVRINANGILSTYSNQIDLNGFMVPLSSDFILVEIDTNTPALFNSRVYSFLFNKAKTTESLQPYLAPVAASILTTVKVLQFENLKPISSVRIKVFKILETGRTLVHDSLTDGKGETTIPFIVADLYEIEVLIDDVLIFTENYIATATTNEHYIFIPATEGVVFPEDITTPSVYFTPVQKHFNTIDVNLGVVVSTTLGNISAIHFFITNNDFNIYDSYLDLGAPVDGNSYSVNINDLAAVSDTNFSFISTVIVVLDDGNSFVFSSSYSLRPGANEILNILMYDMRTEFGCNTSNLSIRCDSLMFVAFFVILFVLCAFAAGASGFVGGPGLSLIGLILTMFFVFIAWIPLWLGFVMVLAALGVILTRTSFSS